MAKNHVWGAQRPKGEPTTILLIGHCVKLPSECVSLYSQINVDLGPQQRTLFNRWWLMLKFTACPSVEHKSLQSVQRHIGHFYHSPSRCEGQGTSWRRSRKTVRARGQEDWSGPAPSGHDSWAPSSCGRLHDIYVRLRQWTFQHGWEGAWEPHP